MRFSALMLAIVAAFGAMMLYALTLAPTIGWGDSADLALRMVRGSDEIFIGTHREYPLYLQLGAVAQLIPVGDAGTRANLFTAFFGALTVGSVAIIAYWLTEDLWASLGGAISLAVAHTFWFLSVSAEVYTFNAALVLVAFAFITKWWYSSNVIWLYFAALFTGLSLSHHATGLVLLMAISLLVILKWDGWRLRDLLVGLLLVIVFSINYWEGAFDRLLQGKGALDTLGLAVSQNVNFKVQPLKEVIKFFGYLGYNFFGLSFVLAIMGLYVMWKNRVVVLWAPLLWAAAFVFAGISSSIPDKFNIYVLTYPVFAIFVAVGFQWLRVRCSISVGGSTGVLAALMVVPPALYLAAVVVSNKLDIDLVGARNAPFRDNAKYFLWPSKRNDYGPRKFAETVLNDALPNSMLIADYTLWRPLKFIQDIEGFRKDVRIVFVEPLLKSGIDDYLRKQDCKMPIQLATNDPPEYYHLEKIERTFDIVEQGSLIKIERAC